MVRSLQTNTPPPRSVKQSLSPANLLGGGLAPAFFKSSLSLCVWRWQPLPIGIWPSESRGKGPSLAIGEGIGIRQFTGRFEKEAARISLNFIAMALVRWSKECYWSILASLSQSSFITNWRRRRLTLRPPDPGEFTQRASVLGLIEVEI